MYTSQKREVRWLPLEREELFKKHPRYVGEEREMWEFCLDCVSKPPCQAPRGGTLNFSVFLLRRDLKGTFSPSLHVPQAWRTSGFAGCSSKSSP